MEREARESQCALSFWSVEFVAHNGVVDGFQMYPDLVRAAGARKEFEQSVRHPPLYHTVLGSRFPLFVPLSARRGPKSRMSSTSSDRTINHPFIVFDASVDKRVIDLEHLL